MHPRVIESVLDLLGASEAGPAERIQCLWSGYGELFRLPLTGFEVPSVVVKWIQPPTAADHPRGWHSDRSHRRKLRSYEVEMHFYGRYSAACDAACRVPRCLGSQVLDGGWLLVLEDLALRDLFPLRRRPSTPRIRACLRWLAAFHARFLGAAPEGLWETGTYWHLATRPDELAVIRDSALRDAAPRLDHKLSAARFQTWVHGDAKLANFCLGAGSASPRVGAVDFQYVGGGCGMKDVAYFIGSCLDEAECEARADALLGHYFDALEQELERQGSGADFSALHAEWSALYPVAWADFHRFLAGWAPSHSKIHRYTERMTREAMQALQ